MAEARSLADIKLDNAYKFGAGRYLQEAGALNLLGGEVARLGKRPWSLPAPAPGSHRRQGRKEPEGCRCGV